jgi:hypothetical protein
MASGKSAAKVATDIANRKSKNKVTTTAEVEVEKSGGIVTDEQPAQAQPAMVTGTPFDLVDGRMNVDYFGPLTAYGFVQTAHGEYAIPQGKIMRFDFRVEWDRKEGVEVTRAYPTYEDAPEELIEYVMASLADVS